MIAYRGGRLHVEGVPAEALARRFGTPLYAYSAGRILQRLAEMRAAFARSRPLLCYALKANPNRSVCRLLARAGCGADIVSGGELARALAAGFAPGRIAFSGAGKTDPELAAAARAGLFCVNVESAEELERLGRTARRLRRRVRFALRVNPSVPAGAHAHVETGRRGAKFGVAPREALALYRRAEVERWLEAAGVQCHAGSQILSAAPYRKALAVVLAVADRLRARGRRLAHADMGGGMGISYDGGPELDLGELAAALEGPVLERGLRLVLEPGRRLVGDAGALLTRVIARKRAGGRRIVVLDAGMNDLLRPALYGARHAVVPAREAGRPRVTLDAVGPVCESADVLGKARRLPWPEPGELWAVLEAGAYGASMGSQYNSRPRPAEVLVRGRRARLARRRETIEDLTRHER